MPEVDIMQTNDLFRLLLLFIYSHEQERHTIFESIKLPDYFELKLLYFSDIIPQHPTYKTLTQDISNKGFKNKLKKFILTQVFLSKQHFPEGWDNKTTFKEVLLFLNIKKHLRQIYILYTIIVSFWMAFLLENFQNKK